MQEEGLTRHHLLLLHKQVQNKSDIEESLHAYINRARISAHGHIFKRLQYFMLVRGVQKSKIILAA